MEGKVGRLIHFGQSIALNAAALVVELPFRRILPGALLVVVHVKVMKEVVDVTMKWLLI